MPLIKSEWDIEVDGPFWAESTRGEFSKSSNLISFSMISSYILKVWRRNPSAHVPFGIANQPSAELIEEAYEEYKRHSESRAPGERSRLELQCQDFS